VARVFINFVILQEHGFHKYPMLTKGLDERNQAMFALEAKRCVPEVLQKIDKCFREAKARLGDSIGMDEFTRLEVTKQVFVISQPFLF
jgi:hypothetical protein